MELSEVGDRVPGPRSDAAGDHLRWELVQVMSRVRPVDLSAVEITALLALLAPALSRVIGGPSARPGLRILTERDEHPVAPNLT